MAARAFTSRIWILPNRRTPGLAAVLIGMWYAGASQGNAAAYLLCFLVLSVVLVSTIHAWANMRGLSLSAGKIVPVFAGEELRVPLSIESTRGKSHFGFHVSARFPKAPVTRTKVDAGIPQHVEIHLPAARRGCFSEFPVRVSSAYPLGFLLARQDFVVRQNYCVYPAPRGELPLPRAFALSRTPTSGTQISGDDYGGVRAWQPGESQRHIDWKAAARDQPLLTKQWTGESEEILHLDWAGLAPMTSEARLSQLARWIVLAERGNATYALDLPGKKLPAARGRVHYHACLRALAEMPESLPDNAA